MNGFSVGPTTPTSRTPWAFATGVPKGFLQDHYCVPAQVEMGVCDSATSTWSEHPSASYGKESGVTSEGTPHVGCGGPCPEGDRSQPTQCSTSPFRGDGSGKSPPRWAMSGVGPMKGVD